MVEVIGNFIASSKDTINITIKLDTTFNLETFIINKAFREYFIHKIVGFINKTFAAYLGWIIVVLDTLDSRDIIVGYFRKANCLNNFGIMRNVVVAVVVSLD